MDIKNYISSGVLEQFVLGLLSEKESREVMDMMKQYPEVAMEVRSIEDGLEAYADLHAVAPTAPLKERVLSEIRAQKQVGPEAQPAKTVTISERKLQPVYWKWYAIAASILLLFSLGLNFFYGSASRQQQAHNTALIQQQQKLQSANALINSRLGLAEQHIQLLSNPEVKSINMAGVNHHDGLIASLYWNKADGNIYLGKTDLPTLPTDKVYQLWAIVDGKPVSLGLYNPQNGTPLQKMEAVTKGQVQAFAITLEKAGGSPAPTMDQMYVMGAS